MKLEHASVLMSEHAFRAKVAFHSLVVGSAIICFEFVAVHQDCHRGQLLLRMCIPAFVLEPALGRLNPVAAELSLLGASTWSWHDRTLLLKHRGCILMVAWLWGVEIVLVRHSLGATLSLTLQ